MFFRRIITNRSTKELCLSLNLFDVSLKISSVKFNIVIEPTFFFRDIVYRKGNSIKNNITITFLRCKIYLVFIKEWMHEIGKLQKPFQVKMSIKLLVYKERSTAQMTPRFLTKVIHTSLEAKMDDLYFCRKTNPRDHEKISLTRVFFFFKKIFSS